jgi:hypothetical protein
MAEEMEDGIWKMEKSFTTENAEGAEEEGDLTADYADGRSFF